MFKRTVRTAVAMKLVDLAAPAVDGPKVAANAARDRTYDAERGGRLLNRLEKAIADLEAQNAAGEDTPAVHLPAELADQRALREPVRPAMDDLNQSQGGMRIGARESLDSRLRTQCGPAVLSRERRTGGDVSGDFAPALSRGQVSNLPPLARVPIEPRLGHLPDRWLLR